MLTILAEQLTLQFYSWELKGRGWQVFDEAVDLEPPFEPFFSHRLPVTEHLYRRGLYLPSGITLTDAEIEKVAAGLKTAL